jgi:isoaspartyl peptidase/L-asparaginase-like protein (Ntn-hydrolase superfamily)
MKNILLLHGGVGSDESFSPRLDKYSKNASDETSPLNNAVKAVVLMEDDVDFNAGTGSYQRIDGSVQMDAAVMVPGKFGSVIAIEKVRNPVLVARDVMGKSPHIMMSGDGAVRFARSMGFQEYDPNTEKAEEQRRKTIEKMAGNDESIPEKFRIFRKYVDIESFMGEAFDTVGAVARINGDFAGAVSTGGSAPMLRGRVGDSPIIGAGIYVGENGAVVATGIGEEIAKRLLCYRIYSRIGEKPLKEILKEEVDYFGDITVGVIALDKEGYAYHANKSMAVGINEF